MKERGSFKKIFMFIKRGILFAVLILGGVYFIACDNPTESSEEVVQTRTQETGSSQPPSSTPAANPETPPSSTPESTPEEPSTPVSTPEVTPEQTVLYSITVNGILNGTVTVNKESAAAGETVTLTATPNTGFKFNSWSVVSADGTVISVTNNSFIMPHKNVSISASFVQLPYTILPAGTSGTAGTNATYVLFGRWPQTIKNQSVVVNRADSKTVGAFTYYKGDDGEWYMEATDNNPAPTYQLNNYKYSDNTIVQTGGTETRWFKVEPIKWRIITNDYNGKTLLLAEDILKDIPFYDYVSSRTQNGVTYYGSINRQIDGKTIYVNNYKYSKVRAFLNGLSYIVKENSDSSQVNNDEFYNSGFLQTAFNDSETLFISNTTLADYNDKIFLLSRNDVRKSEYGFDDTTYKKYPDFVLAAGVYCFQYTKNWEKESCWWLLTDDKLYLYKAYSFTNYVTSVRDKIGTVDVNLNFGVVPALCLEN